MFERMRSLGGRRVAAVMVLAAAALAAGCETLKPYEKEYLLSPVMDDRSVDGLRPALMSSAAGSFEKLGTGGPGAGGSTSCPTCGG
jgi:hypothetical protein